LICIKARAGRCDFAAAVPSTLGALRELALRFV
jgi:hypothetical protein